MPKEVQVRENHRYASLQVLMPLAQQSKAVYFQSSLIAKYRPRKPRTFCGSVLAIELIDNAGF